MNELDNQPVDIRASLYKGIAGAIPVAGPIISEIISSIIPNQRIDRIALFLKQLNERINALEQEELKNNQYFIDLFEDGVIQASRALSDKRNTYLAVFLSKSININKSNYTSKKKLFHILQELTDQDIIILKEIKDEGHWKTAVKYTAPSISIGDYEKLTNEEKYEHDLYNSLWDSHINTLERFNLIAAEREKLNIEYGIENINDHLDEETGLPKITGYTYTILGKSLLNSITE